VSQIRIGQSLGFVANQEADVASRGLLLQQPEPQAGAIDRSGVLSALEAVSRATPAIPPTFAAPLK
jgi:hypothetical protein